MPVSKYYVGDVGTVIEVDCVENISSGTEFKLKVRKPSGTAVTWVGALYGTTKIQYTVGSGDWDEDGRYELQAYVAMPGWTGLGDTDTFQVEKPYK